jgi:hypothetical protein
MDVAVVMDVPIAVTKSRFARGITYLTPFQRFRKSVNAFSVVKGIMTAKKTITVQRVEIRGKPRSMRTRPSNKTRCPNQRPKRELQQRSIPFSRRVRVQLKQSSIMAPPLRSQTCDWLPVSDSRISNSKRASHRLASGWSTIRNLTLRLNLGEW